jgi:predicted nucleic acid-binding protein
MSDKTSEISFIDTNIWLYAFIEDDEKTKSEKARELILSTRPVVSVQVINEVSVNLIKKAGIPEDKIRHLILSFFQICHIKELDQETLTFASNLREKYMFSFWDSLIVSSAFLSQWTYFIQKICRTDWWLKTS